MLGKPITTPAYQQVTTHPNGVVKHDDISADGATHLINRAIRFLKLDVVPAGDTSGRITVRQPTWHQGTPAAITYEYTPVHAPRMTEVQYTDLWSIAASTYRVMGRPSSGGRLSVSRQGHVRIETDLDPVPPAASMRLIERGWVNLLGYMEHGVPVKVSIAGTVSMFLHLHKITTSRRGTKAYSAACACEDWSVSGTSRGAARIQAEQHRAAVLKAALGIPEGPSRPDTPA